LSRKHDCHIPAHNPQLADIGPEFKLSRSYFTASQHRTVPEHSALCDEGKSARPVRSTTCWWIFCSGTRRVKFKLFIACIHEVFKYGVETPALMTGIDSMVMVLFFALSNRNHAPMRDFANRVLELDGGVVNPKVVVQAIFHVPQDALTDGRRNVGNGNVAR
jgi:hypothetical protein